MRLIGEFRWGAFRIGPRASTDRRYARTRATVTQTAVPRTIVGGANPGRSAVAPPVRPGQTSSLCPANAAISATPLRRTHKAWVHHDVLGGRHNQRYVVVEHSGFASSLGTCTAGSVRRVRSGEQEPPAGHDTAHTSTNTPVTFHSGVRQPCHCRAPIRKGRHCGARDSEVNAARYHGASDAITTAPSHG